MKNTTTCIRTCPICGTVSMITVDTACFNKYLAGEYIQNAFPNLPADDRELILSGMCKDCQKMFFAPLDEDDA